MFVGYFVHNHTIMNFFATGHAYGRAPHVHVTLIPSITARGYRLMVPIFQFNNDHVAVCDNN